MIKDSTVDVPWDIEFNRSIWLSKFFFVCLYQRFSEHHSRDIACAISNSNDIRTLKLAWNEKVIFPNWRLFRAFVLPDQNFSCRDTPHNFLYQIHSLASPCLNMQSLCNPKNHGHQMLVSSPRCSLNCQALSIHLPPLGDKRISSGNNYLSPPMSGSFDPSTFEDPTHHHPNNHHHHHQRQYSLTPPSRPSTSGKSDTRAARAKIGLGKDVRVDLSTPNSTDRETSGTSLQLSSDTHTVLGDLNDEVSSNAHDSPEGQLVAGPPGIARRAKAHVPSACVNCKKKHLACETKRPCNRCIQTGKEVS